MNLRRSAHALWHVLICNSAMATELVNGDSSTSKQLPERLRQYIEGVPKAELHVHIEGTLEPELMFEIAVRNGVALKGTIDSHRDKRRSFKVSVSGALRYCQGRAWGCRSIALYRGSTKGGRG